MSGNWLKSSTRKGKESVAALDFSQLLKDPNSFQFRSKLRELGLHSQISAVAYDPTQSLLAVATFTGAVYIFGQAGVETSFPNSSRGIKVKHLAFKPGSGLLCVVDSQSSLSVWDLTRLENGKPTKDCTISMRSEVTCVETSASLSTIFFGCGDGTVDVLDIQSATILRNARIPNLWTQQEELLRRSGSESARSRNYVPICTDIKLHPLDPSIIFIAYEGGVAQWDIVERQCQRTWEFVLPPGAPGGIGSAVGNLFTERRPAVTCLTIRPDALLFATGHADGSISFVSTVDENVISMRTIEKADVNKATEEDLFGWSPESDRSNGREPVFKLSWSGYPEESLLEKVHGWSGFGAVPVNSPTSTTPHGGTTLTILGGSLPSDGNSIAVLHFPPFKLPSQHASSSTIALSAPLRAALRESVTPYHHSFYPTASPVEDYLLIPRDTPHLGNNFDPTAILIITDTDPTLPVLAEPHADRAIDAYSFPPSLQGSSPFRKLELPSTLNWSSGGTATSCQIYTLDQNTYKKLLSSASDRNRLPLRGGKALGNGKSASGFKILVSLHLDLTIRFHDISDHLLAAVDRRSSPSSPSVIDEDAPPPTLKSEYPRLLHHLTIDLKQVLNHPATQELDSSRLYKARPWELEFRNEISFASEALEISVAFVTGDVIVSRFVYGSGASNGSAASDPSQREEDRLSESVAAALQGLEMDDEPSSKFANSANRRDPASPLDLSAVYPHLPTFNTFRPFLAYSVAPTPNLRLAHSDLGFLAISTGSHLSIIDLRGPDVMLSEGGKVSGEEKKKLKKLGRANIASLTWTICATTADAEQALRLIVVHATGDVRLFELQLVSGHWILLDKVISFAHDHLADALTTFVINHHGDECKANAYCHQSAVASQQYHSTSDHDNAVPSLWIAVTPRGLSTYLGIDGVKIYASSNEGSRFVGATLIERSGFSVVAAFSERGDISIFSLPDLLPITRLSLETALHASIGTISCSTDGDILHFIDPLTIRLSTIFNFKRPTFPPTLELHDPTLVATTQLASLTTGLTSTLSSYFGGRRISTVAEIEASLSGPNPPPAKLRKPSIAFTPQANSAASIAAAYLPAASTSTSTANPTRSPTAAPSRTANVATEATYLSQTMQWTNDALAQRGEHLNNLSEAMNEAGAAARNFAMETKKMATQEAAKRTMMGGFTSMFK